MDAQQRIRERLIAALSDTAGAGPHCALLVDQVTLRIVSHAVRLSDLLEELPHITLLQRIDADVEARAPLLLQPGMDVIYLIEPTRPSLDCALADHRLDARPVYGGSVHFVFSRRVPEELIELIRAAPVVSRISTLRELNLQFIVLGRRVFSLDAPHALRTLYGPLDKTARESAMGVLAEQVCTVFSSLMLPIPRVRYSAQGHPACRVFAQRMEAMLTEALTVSEAAAAETRGESNSMCSATASRQGTLLIIDRSFDTVTPLLYDFSYEALAEGFGLLRHGRFAPRSGSSSDSHELDAPAVPREVLLLDSDPIWADLRQRPFEQVPDALAEHTRVFFREHEAVVRAEKGRGQLSAAQRLEASRMQLAFSYRKRHEQLKVQEELVRSVTEMLLTRGSEETQLFRQLSFEQDLATGQKLDGAELRTKDALSCTIRELCRISQGSSTEASPAAEPTKHSTAVSNGDGQAGVPASAAAAPAVPADSSSAGRLADMSIMQGPTLTAQQRSACEQCRLLALLTMCRHLTDAECTNAMRSAAMPSSLFLPILRSFTFIGLPLLPPLHTARPGPGAQVGMVPLRRHVPRLHQLLQSLLDGSMSSDTFPHVDGHDVNFHTPADPCHTDGATPSPQSELIGSWAFRRPNNLRKKSANSPPTVFVCLLGGASHAEARIVHEWDGAVALVSTALHTPLDYIGALTELGENVVAPSSDVRSLLSF